MMGIGVAGLVSSIIFVIFPLDESFAWTGSDLLSTLGLLTMTFAVILLMGLTINPTKRTSRDGSSPTGSRWLKQCSKCGKTLRRRTAFCPACGVDVR